ncbi:MAG: cofactor-independent phosphoglycerate mutase [Gemmatales bacterium]|nr:cofactor-independent phosphoglycerate mutase [Gemmatales bacterium]MDW8175247.1 cofactor-independent phosphoglycerate mutase [Gemmatales bacterium]MDW8222694.1 cofactor-independent phosphoglycerate mutase [Gemmatales bacterium]
MKYAIIIPDGAADEPVEELHGRTPLQAARKPHMDRLARQGRLGLSNNVPDPFTPASDVAMLSVFGYDPLRYYTGRAPLEAAAQGIRLGPNDWAIRCNLVYIENEEMRDFTAGHISSEEARELIATLQQSLGTASWQFLPGVSYRNLLIYRGEGPGLFSADTRTQAPHDIPNRSIADYLPRGPGSEVLRDLMERSREILREHPINEKRRMQGKRPATQIWLWGLGQAPSLQPFQRLYGKRGAIISAVDLVRGVGALIGWDRIEVPGATGYIDTDYAAKGRYAVRALGDYDIICVHIEAPDEASHEGRADTKVWTIEQIDQHIVGPLAEALVNYPQWRIWITPDHRTTLATRAHARGPVPWVMAGTNIAAEQFNDYDELEAEQSRYRFEEGWRVMTMFLSSEANYETTL